MHEPRDSQPAAGVPWPAAWPTPPAADWGATLTTIHLWTQIVGKIRLALAPPMSHWWHATLYVSPRGLTTSAMPYGAGLVEAEFDFLSHVLRWSDSAGHVVELPLPGMSVADLHRAIQGVLRELGIVLRAEPTWRPVELPESIPFAEDTGHATYVPAHAIALHRALIDAHRVLSMFRARFVGKASPVHFWWGSFDLAVTRFSGRTAPRPASFPPNCPPWVMDEAYSHEVSSAGWWPRIDSVEGSSFYSYAYPSPDGFNAADVQPAGARYDADLGEFVVPQSVIAAAPEPDVALLAFLESTYSAAAEAAGWDRAALEPPTYPVGLPRSAWSTVEGDR